MRRLSKEEIGYKPTDKLIRMWLLNPHDHHFLNQKEDGSYYGWSNIKGEGDWYWEAHNIQLELKL